jgi:Calcineurin-like phosphoesterase
MRVERAPMTRVAFAIVVCSFLAVSMLAVSNRISEPTRAHRAAGKAVAGFIQRVDSLSSRKPLDPLGHLSEKSRRASWKKVNAGCEVVGLRAGRVGGGWPRGVLLHNESTWGGAKGGSNDLPRGSRAWRARVYGEPPYATNDAASNSDLSFGSNSGGNRVALSQANVPVSDGRVAAARAEGREGLVFGMVGDEGVGQRTSVVLQLAREENAAFVLSAGDLAYRNHAASEWESQLDRVLGESYPYYTAIGNHDVGRWSEYAPRLVRRAERVRREKGYPCTGDLGVASVCAVEGFLVVFSGVGTLCNSTFDHVGYVRRALRHTSTAHFRWRLCVFHKNQRLMQRGEKEDMTGWGVYEECRKAGAIILSGHDHGYARTRLVSKFADRPQFDERGEHRVLRLAHGDATGRTVSILSGLGGKGVRQAEGNLDKSPWYASTLSNGDPQANSGMVLCTASWQGTPKLTCKFKTIDGAVTDTFEIVAPESRA